MVRSYQLANNVDNPTDYQSGHYGAYGLNIIAVCDHLLRFSYMAVAGTGRTNDNRSVRKLQRLR
jgi:hypothetical protein